MASPEPTVRVGNRAEERARAWLEARGLVLVERNVRFRNGELDLVMLDGRELVIVEVRYRASGAMVGPAVSIDSRKRGRLLRAAATYLQSRPRFADHPVRIDVLALSGDLAAPHCDWLRDAVRTDDTGRW